MYWSCTSTVAAPFLRSPTSAATLTVACARRRRCESWATTQTCTCDPSTAPTAPGTAAHSNNAKERWRSCRSSTPAKDRLTCHRPRLVRPAGPERGTVPPARRPRALRTRRTHRLAQPRRRPDPARHRRGRTGPVTRRRRHGAANRRHQRHASRRGKGPPTTGCLRPSGASPSPTTSTPSRSTRPHVETAPVDPAGIAGRHEKPDRDQEEADDGHR